MPAIAGDDWLMSLTLRFTTDAGPLGLGQPSSVVPIVYPGHGSDSSQPGHYDGGFSSPAYNANRTIQFGSQGAKHAAIAAIITGHGGCEFVSTSHNFTVNGQSFSTLSPEYADRFMQAGTEFGCANKTIRGAVPNEHGTWYYGRNGWCDGEDVKPLVWDITGALASSGSNTLNYHALSYPGGENGCKGDIDMSSYLLFW